MCCVHKSKVYVGSVLEMLTGLQYIGRLTKHYEIYPITQWGLDSLSVVTINNCIFTASN